MAATYVATTLNNGGATERTSVTFSVTVAAGSDLSMAIAISLEQAGAVVDSVTFNGVAATLIASQANATFGRAELWGLTPPAVGTFDVVISWGSPSSRHVAAVVVASGVDQAGGTGSFRTAGTSSGNGTSATDTVPSVTSDDLCVEVLNIDGTGHAAAVGADQTERWNAETTSGANTGCGSTQPGSAGGIMSWTWTTSAPYAHVASAFKGTVTASGALPTSLTYAPPRTRYTVPSPFFFSFGSPGPSLVPAGRSLGISPYTIRHPGSEAIHLKPGYPDSVTPATDRLVSWLIGPEIVRARHPYTAPLFLNPSREYTPVAGKNLWLLQIGETYRAPHHAGYFAPVILTVWHTGEEPPIAIYPDYLWLLRRRRDPISASGEQPLPLSYHKP